jgi:hypothetical protein
MEVLQANNGQEIQYIISSHVYVKVWDYGKKLLLTHLKIPNVATSMSETIWAWIKLNEGEMTDLADSCSASFDDAINKAVNNPYCTVYEFSSYEEMIDNWEAIKYIETITTTFKSTRDD